VPASIPGDAEAFGRFVEAEYQRLVRAVALACGSAVVAEDAVQEALARAWERRRRGEQIESLGKWTVTVALNVVRSGARRARIQRRIWPRLAQDVTWNPVGDVEGVDLRAALTGLPRRQREATVLHYYLGLPLREIAGVLGVSEGTVKTALWRARATLARHLEDQHDEDEEMDDVEPA
jgi:RNA polymerase sigma-70 factor (ECF subfamily)